MKKINKWFTLIEVVVSVTIFSIMMVSMISIYILSSETTLKSDINRAMHENIKSVVTEMSEDIIKNWLSGVSNSTIDSCDFDLTGNYKQWTKLCTKSLNNYYLAKKVSWTYPRVNNSDCLWLADQCYIVKNGIPLTNSLVSIKDLNFYISNSRVNKATIIITLQPTIKAWVKPNAIKENKIIFQTSISERLF